MQLANYEVCYANQFHADLEGFNIRSTGFTLSGVEGTVYLTDVTQTADGKNIWCGSVFPKTGSWSIKIKYINEDVGKVDTLKVKLSSIPVTITSTMLSKIELKLK